MFGSKKVEDEILLRKDRTVRFHPDEKQAPAKTVYQDLQSGKLVSSKVHGSKVFQEDHEPLQWRILDPGSNFVLNWNRIFLVSCLVALFLNPLFFFLPFVEAGDQTSCVEIDKSLSITLTSLQSLADLFYVLHIIMKFRTAYVAPSSRVFGRGELVMDPRKIAIRYLRSDFFLDLVAAIPLPQIVVWLVIPTIGKPNPGNNTIALAVGVLFQYIFRFYLIFPLSYEIIKTNGVVTKTAWAGAAYNVILYMLGSHIAGASWYLLTVDRQITCWKSQCEAEENITFCETKFLDCQFSGQDDVNQWAQNTSVFSNCNATNTSIIFNFGIFRPALINNAVSTKFLKKYFYCLWWGLQSLSSYGQNLFTSTFIGETTFCIVLCILGLVLFADLIGNMQTYLQSINVRLEEWRLKRRDTEEWMRHRQLPHDLRERVRRFLQYKWLATRGVDEESILRALPGDIRRDIQRHLSLDLIRRVPFFSQMDDQLLDAICERLVSSLSTEGTYIVREGDPVTEMLFIIRGRIESSTTNGGRTGFFNSITLRPGDFCGEELLAWALIPKSTGNLPSSTRTVKALVEVEAFALRAEDLKFVASQFRRLHSKKLQHTFRFYSHHWRTWAACFIQAAWRRFKRRKMAKELSTMESFSSRSEERAVDDSRQEEEESSSSMTSPRLEQNLSIARIASMFAASTRKGSQFMKGTDMPKFAKPDEPDFSAYPYD